MKKNCSYWIFFNVACLKISLFYQQGFKSKPIRFKKEREKDRKEEKKREKQEGEETPKN